VGPITCAARRSLRLKNDPARFRVKREGVRDVLRGMVERLLHGIGTSIDCDQPRYAVIMEATNPRRLILPIYRVSGR